MKIRVKSFISVITMITMIIMITMMFLVLSACGQKDTPPTVVDNTPTSESIDITTTAATTTESETTTEASETTTTEDPTTTTAPTTAAPTTAAPTTAKPTAAPTTAAPTTAAPTTAKPTAAPTTAAPTTAAPTTAKPTVAPTTEAKPNLPKTDKPTVTAKVYSHNTIYLLGGKCEIGAKIKVTGGTEEMLIASEHGDFLVEVPFSGSVTLTLTAIADGKSPSEELTFAVSTQRNIRHYSSSSDYSTIIGYDSMAFFSSCVPDYEGTNFINQTEIDKIKERTEKKIKDLRDRNCEAEIVYLLVTNSMRLWPELVPSRFTRYTGDDSLKKQWIQGVTAGGGTVIDLYDVLTAHKNDEYRLFFRTDSHWTEYGAMFGYFELMNYIAQKFPDAAPRPQSDFEPYKVSDLGGGDVAWLTGSELNIKETGTFVKFNFDPPGGRFAPFYDGKVRVDNQSTNYAQTTKTNLTGEFPSAYVMRDSFGGPIHQFLLDRFSTMNFKWSGDYYFDAKDIASKNPDYVLYIISERNIKYVLYE